MAVAQPNLTQPAQEQVVWPKTTPAPTVPVNETGLRHDRFHLTPSIW